MFRFILLLIIITAVQCFAFEELSGDLPRILTASRSPYVVLSDICVPSGRSVKIEPGCVFLFKNFTGLHVEGVLLANGTAEHSIVFTTENDRTCDSLAKLYPTPYDWNGIYIHRDAIGTELSHCVVTYSVKGVLSETKFIKLESCRFKENGRSNLSIEGSEKTVSENEPYSYSVSLKDATVDGVPVKILQDPGFAKRVTLRYSGLSFLVGGAALGGISAIQFFQADKSLQQYSRIADDNLKDVDGPSEWERYFKEKHVSETRAWIGIGLVLVGITGFSWSFTF